MHAAHSAAQADGLPEPNVNPNAGTTDSAADAFAKQHNLGLDHALNASANNQVQRKVPGSGGKKKGPPLRRGKVCY